MPLGWGGVKMWDLEIFAIVLLCCRRGHPCFTNTCLVDIPMVSTESQVLYSFINITTQSVASPRLHKLISIYLHCDLDLWPLTSKINRVHPLIMVNMSAKFDKEICNGLVSIVFTRFSHGRKDARTEPQKRYYIPTATRCAGIIKVRTDTPIFYFLIFFW